MATGYTIRRGPWGPAPGCKADLDPGMLAAARAASRNPTSMDRQAASIVARALAGGVVFVVSTLTIDEFCWTLLKMHYANDHGGQYPTRGHFKKNPDDVRKYAPAVTKAVTQFLSLPNVQLLPDGRLDGRQWTTAALDAISTHSLEPRDSFHLAAARVAKLDALLTADRDFARLGTPAPGGFEVCVP